MRSRVGGPVAALALALVAGAAACMAPVRLYPGPERPPAEVAVLEVGEHTRIRVADGRPVETRRIEMLPGRIEVELETVRRSMREYDVRIRCRLALPAEAGTVVRVEHAPDGGAASYYRGGVFGLGEAGYRVGRRRHDGRPPSGDAALVGRCRYGVGAACRATSDRPECRPDDDGGRTLRFEGPVR